MDTQQLERLLTLKQVMSYLQISRSTLYRLMWAGKLEGHKVGGTWRFFAADVNQSIRKDIAS